MPAPMTTRTTATPNLNHLRRGATYRATTRATTVVGEYLGEEAPHGDRAILLRHGAGTTSIEVGSVTSIYPEAA